MCRRQKGSAVRFEVCIHANWDISGKLIEIFLPEMHRSILHDNTEQPFRCCLIAGNQSYMWHFLHINKVPAAPGSKEDFELIKAEDATDPDKPVGDREEMYKTLEQELIQQIRVII